MTESTDLILPEATTIATLLSNKGGIDPIIDKIAERVRSEAAGIDVSSKSGRERLKSLAHNVSRSKTEIERQADILKEDAQKLIKSVNAEVNTARAKCDALRDEIKKPALDWEAAEQARISKIKLAMNKFIQVVVPESPKDIKDTIDCISNVEIDSFWQEFKLEAKKAKEVCLDKLNIALGLAISREEAKALAEQQVAELEQLRREKAEREEKDRILAIERAEESRRIEREKQEKEDHRLQQEYAKRQEEEVGRAEAQRVAKIEKDKQEAARIAVEKAEKEAAEREAALKRQAEEEKLRHEREMAEAKVREEAAAQRERDRIAAERQAEADARAKREADAKHRENIRGVISISLKSLGLDFVSAETIADALMDGKIPHCKVIL